MDVVPGSPGEPFVFLSYARSDRESADAVARFLDSVGISVWIDRSGISAGTDWAEEIVVSVRSCSVFLILCSLSSIESRNVRQELQLAWDSDRQILPLILEPVEFPDAISYFLQGRQWIETVGRRDSDWLGELQSAVVRLGVQVVSPVMRTPAEGPGTLPRSGGQLIGRDSEIDDLTERLLAGSRLVTLTGPGGVGKTRLAVETAHRVAESFAGDAQFIDLTAISSSEHVPSAILQVLGIRESTDRSIRETLKLALRNRRLLLVLDNFEHVIDAAPDMAELVTGSLNMVTLVTSREALRIRGEEVLTVEPLSVPTMQDFDIADLSRSPAVRLFIQTASQAKPGFELTQSNAHAISEICRRLDGLPLAIELASSRARYFPPATLLEHLERRLPTLTGGPRDLPARHQTLRDAIAWSYDLLTPDEKTLFRRISAFPGGASLAALDTYAKVAGGVKLELLSGLSSLVDKSLIRERLGSDGTPRFSMLETIREFADEMTVACGELDTHHRALVAMALEFVSLGKGNAQAWFLRAARLREVDDELENVLAGFGIAADRGEAESCALLFTEMHGYLLVRGMYREADTMGRKVLELAESSPISDSLRGRTLTDLSYFWTSLVGPVEGEEMARKGLALTRNASDSVLNRISALDGIITALRGQGHFVEALAVAAEADELGSASGSELIRSSTQYFLGNLFHLADDREQAIECLREAMRLGQGNEFTIYAGSDLVDVYLRQGQVQDAASTLGQVLQAWQEADSGANGRPLDRAALLAAAGDRYEVAAKLFAANAVQNALFGMRDRDDRWTTDAIEATRVQLGMEEFESACRAGRSLSLKEATEMALELVDDIKSGSREHSPAR